MNPAKTMMYSKLIFSHGTVHSNRLEVKPLWWESPGKKS